MRRAHRILTALLATLSAARLHVDVYNPETIVILGFAKCGTWERYSRLQLSIPEIVNCVPLRNFYEMYSNFTINYILLPVT